jgi:hypothetical protein
MKMTDKTSKILFFIGIILLGIGAFGLTFAAFFAIIGLPVFVIGIILIFVAKKTWKQKLIPIGLFIVGIIIFWPIWTKINSVGPETYLISENYRGKINIIYGEYCGKELIEENSRLIYEIPDDGILIVNKELKYGIVNHEYYLVDENGTRTKLQMMDVRNFNEEYTIEKNPNEPSRSKLGIFGNSTGGSSNSQDENDGFEFQEFYVSTYSDLKEKYEFKYNRKFDSIRQAKLGNCRTE